MDWDDLKVLLAVQRGGSLHQAARLLRVNKSTVSRRMAALEASLGVELVHRGGSGAALTPAGLAVSRRAEAMDEAARGIEGAWAEDATVRGRVRLTAVPLVTNHILLPALGRLTDATRDVALELVAEARDLDLAAGDADMAVRLARPRGGGQAVLARRIGALDYGCFAVAGGQDLPWIGYEPRMQYLSHAQAIEAIADKVAPVSVNDAETLLQAVKAGLGKSLFPRRIGRAAGLEEVPMTNLPTREVWLLVRRDMRDLARVRAVVDWVEGALSKPAQDGVRDG